jgi:anti-anti-sigma factor
MEERRTNIETSRHGPVAYVRLAGELDYTSREDLISTFDDVMRVRATDQVIVDMRPTELIDSTVLGVLVMAEKRARQLGIRLVFAKGCPAAHRPFELTHIDQYLTFVQL